MINEPRERLLLLPGGWWPLSCQRDSATTPNGNSKQRRNISVKRLDEAMSKMRAKKRRGDSKKILFTQKHKPPLAKVSSDHSFSSMTAKDTTKQHKLSSCAIQQLQKHPLRVTGAMIAAWPSYTTYFIASITIICLLQLAAVAQVLTAATSGNGSGGLQMVALGELSGEFIYICFWALSIAAEVDVVARCWAPKMML